MNILKIAAFADENKSGNPAGVVIYDEMSMECELLKTETSHGNHLF